MVALRGVVVKKEEAEVEVSPEELRVVALKELSTFSLALLARASWLGSKGLGEDVKIFESSGSRHWQEYEDNGSHYSGYYGTKTPYEEGDKEKLEAFDTLINKLR